MQNDNSEYIPDGQVKCFNCGAVHSVDDPRCPYCGALNPVGAEKAYMNELDDLKDETDQLAEDAEDDFGDNVQSNAKRIVLIAIIAIAAAFTGLSRGQAEKLFGAEKVFVNGRVILDKSTRLKEGDVLSVRGFGKAVYDGIEHETKKNRLWVSLRKYV